MTDFETLIKKLIQSKIEFVLIGGVAAVVHGSAYETSDLDICYQRNDENIKKLVKFLRSLQASLRDVEEKLPFLLDEKTIKMGCNFTFQTKLGALDIFGDVPGLGDYSKIKNFSEPLDLYGCKVFVLSLEGLIRAKKTANRPKDKLHLKELEALKSLKGR